MNNFDILPRFAWLLRGLVSFSLGEITPVFDVPGEEGAGTATITFCGCIPANEATRRNLLWKFTNGICGALKERKAGN
jgi:hypothetical protein